MSLAEQVGQVEQAGLEADPLVAAEAVRVGQVAAEE